MALHNPYTIDEDEQMVRGVFDGPFDVDAVNDNLRGDRRVTDIRECDCGDRSFGATVQKGDKWHLRLCGNCNGLYGWHDVRADYL